MESEIQLPSRTERFMYYASLFDVSQQQLQKCFNAFISEIQRGLEMHVRDPYTFRPEESSLMMLDSCIDKLPTGREQGVAYAVDFGGTNIRAICCNLNGQGQIKMNVLSHNVRTAHTSPDLPKGLLDSKATATLLFDEIAELIEKLAKNEVMKKGQNYGLGLTFSFAVSQKSINSARLISWTKGFETGCNTTDPVVGQDVCALLDAALSRKKIPAKTVAILNDTVGCLLAGSYFKSIEMPPCLVGITIGTGLNGAYVQRNAKTYGYKGIIINTELGNFDKDLPRNDVDYEIDYASTNPGRQICEKMVSGMYIPEMIRILILRVFQHEAPEIAWVPYSLTGEGCNEVFVDASKVASVFENEWSWKIEDQEQLELLHKLTCAVYKRSAAIAAVLIAAMAKATGSLQPAMGGLTVRVDGTLCVKNIIYRQLVLDYLKSILNEDTASLVNLIIAEDGSGQGAAILAATTPLT